MAISPCFDQFFSDLAENTFVLHTSALKSATCPFLSAIHPPTHTHTHITDTCTVLSVSRGFMLRWVLSLSPSVVFAACALCPIGTSCVGRRCMCQILSALERFCLQGLDREQPRLTSTFKEWKTKREKEANLYSLEGIRSCREFFISVCC